MDGYSIVTLLATLANDDLEKKLIELVSEGLVDEELLDKILEAMKEEKR